MVRDLKSVAYLMKWREDEVRNVAVSMTQDGNCEDSKADTGDKNGEQDW
jgi:hypothetical protein